MTKNNIGLYNAKTCKWLPWQGARLWKPTPYNTDRNYAAFEQWLELSERKPEIQLRRIPAADLREMGAMK